MPFEVFVSTANNGTLHGLSKGSLPIPRLAPTATECHRVKNLHTPLLSIEQLCDDKCTSIFNKHNVIIAKNNAVKVTLSGKPILQGLRSSNKLWYIPVPKMQHHQANSAYHQPNAKKLAIFLHAAAGYPPVSSFCKAIDAGFFSTWPGLTTKLVRQ